MKTQKTPDKAHETLEEILVRQGELDARHLAERAAIQTLRTEAGARRRPLDEMTTLRRAQKSRIQNAEDQRTIQLARQLDFQERAGTVFASDGEMFGRMCRGFLSLCEHFPEGAVAERAVAEIDKWLPAQREKLGEMTKAISAYAAEHQLEYALTPEDLS